MKKRKAISMKWRLGFIRADAIDLNRLEVYHPLSGGRGAGSKVLQVFQKSGN
jgi:hypothetical protein